MFQQVKHRAGAQLSRAMREQVFKVDLILRNFSEFLVVGAPSMLSELNLSDVVERALEVLGHEARKRRVKVKAEVEPGLSARLDDPARSRCNTTVSRSAPAIRTVTNATHCPFGEIVGARPTPSRRGSLPRSVAT
jgi:hypothetical protein